MKTLDKNSREIEQKLTIIKWASSSSNSINTKTYEPIADQLKKIVKRELDKITLSK